MLKNKIELIRDGAPRVLITWHKRDESGQSTPVAIEYVDQLEPELMERVEHFALQPLYAVVDGTRKLVRPGSSAHFLGLPKVLERLGFRSRMF